ncbi:MAG: hypothetical protein ACLQVI_03630 [Polyangiaceae bacterium]
MTPHTAPRPTTSRELLERLRRDVLARVLDPYRLYLEAKHVPLDALRATHQDDLSLVDALFALLADADAGAPLPLLEALAAIDAVASDAGHERLRMLDKGKLLPQERLGHETLAAIAFLEQPALFAQVKVAAKGPSATAQVEYAAKSNRPFPRDPARFAALGRAMAELFKSRGRPEHCEPRVTWGARETSVELIFGRLPATSERLTETLTRTQSVDTFTQRARAVLHHATGNLAVTGFEFMREGMRRLFGEHLLDDADHFQRCDLYALGPLEEDLGAALSAEPALAVEKIELREIHVRRADGALSAYSHAADLLESSVGEEIRAALAAGGRAEHAKLSLQLASRKRPVRVEITPPRRLDLARGDDAVVDAVRALLAHKRFLREPARESVHESMVVPSQGEDGGSEAGAQGAESALAAT